MTAGVRRLGFVFAVIGGLLLFVAGLVELTGGVADIVFYHGSASGFLSTPGEFFVVVVIGLLVLFFGAIGSRPGPDYSLAGGSVLFLLALFTWLLLGLSPLLLLGGLFALIAGVLVLLGRA